jgi:hypothetical protein
VRTTEQAGVSAMPWQTLDIERAKALVDARQQLHHAAQFATAVGISYLPPASDDSHTNLEWVASLGALASRFTTSGVPFRLAVRVSKPALLLVDEHNEMRASCSLNGHTIDDVMRWIRVMLADFEVNVRQYTLEKHFSIPPHPVSSGAPFNTADSGAEFEELSRWYGNAAALLERVAVATPGASEVRCWPHHFDIATLIEVSHATGNMPARTVGMGLEPGDQYYAEPYFYMNMSPAPRKGAALPPLSGGGDWHTHEWIGAVLPASRLTTPDQRAQVDAFVGSALTACRQLVLAV